MQTSNKAIGTRNGFGQMSEARVSPIARMMRMVKAVIEPES